VRCVEPSRSGCRVSRRRPRRTPRATRRRIRTRQPGDRPAHAQAGHGPGRPSWFPVAQPFSLRPCERLGFQTSPSIRVAASAITRSRTAWPKFWPGRPAGCGWQTDRRILVPPDRRERQFWRQEGAGRRGAVGCGTCAARGFGTEPARDGPLHQRGTERGMRWASCSVRGSRATCSRASGTRRMGRGDGRMARKPICGGVPRGPDPTALRGRRKPVARWIIVA